MDFAVCLTRFSNKTYSENENWKDKMGYTFTKRFYNTPVKIKSTINFDKILVIEANIDENEIIAFGIIKNICQRWKYRIYSNDCYNIFTYISSKYMYSQEIDRMYNDKMEILKRELFKGRGHLKRGTGIQEIPNKKIELIKPFLIYIFNRLEN